MVGTSIVGVGAITGYGIGTPALMKGLQSGVSSVRPQAAPEGGLPENSWYAKVPVEDDPDAKQSRFAVGFEGALNEAIADALARSWKPGDKVAIVHGSARGDIVRMKAMLDGHDENVKKAYISSLPSTPLAFAARKYGYHGPVFTINGTCASGLFALSTARRLLAVGDATDVIVCAAEIGCPLGAFDGLEDLGVLFTDRPPFDVMRPFSNHSNGFVVGEGAAAVVLTNGKHDARYMELASSVLANDGYHAISIDPSHEQISVALKDALEASGASHEAVKSYVAHGTGTRQCNEADEHVLKLLPDIDRVIAVKPWLGHCRGAASLLETVVMALGTQKTETESAFLSQLQPNDLQLTDQPGSLFPALHMSLGAGGNIAIAVYDH